MWHEARKQEKKVREVMVNLQRRAERRKEHYDRQLGDPLQLLRTTGIQAKIHLDPAISIAGDAKTTMLPWSGNPDILISQYDVRVHLETIPDYSKLPKHKVSPTEYAEEGKCNYERYRNLVINMFKEVSEDDCLKKLAIDEMYPTSSGTNLDTKKPSGSKAAIGYSYKDSTGQDECHGGSEDESDSFDEEEELELDLDELPAVDVDKLNLCALNFDISASYFSKMLHVEKSQQTQQQMARQAAADTRHLQGKHARRERRILKEQSRHFAFIQTTPPSYAQRDSPTYEPYDKGKDVRSRSCSRSTTPEVVDSKVEYITEFGVASESDEGTSKKKPYSQSHRKVSTSSSKSHGRSRHYDKSSRSRSTSRERYHHRHYKPHPRRDEKDDRRRHRSHSSSEDRSRHKHRSHSSRTSYHSRSHYSRSRSRSRSVSPPPIKRSRHRRSSTDSASIDSRSHSPVIERAKVKKSTPPKKAAPKKSDGPKLTPQEKLQKKLQLQLNKQFKQDRKTEKEKAMLKAAEQMEREDVLHEQVRRWKNRDDSGYRDRNN